MSSSPSPQVRPPHTLLNELVDLLYLCLLEFGQDVSLPTANKKNLSDASSLPEHEQLLAVEVDGGATKLRQQNLVTLLQRHSDALTSLRMKRTRTNSHDKTFILVCLGLLGNQDTSGGFL